MGTLGKGLPRNTGLGNPPWVTLVGMQYSINDAAKALGVSPNTVRRRLTSGLLTGNKVGNQWVINVPDDAEIPPKPALASDKEPLVSGTEALAWGTEALASRELIDQLRADLANTINRITFLEGHISQLTRALPPGTPEPKPKKQSRLSRWWSRAGWW